MSTAFLQWWREHAPKGANNSVNALIIVQLIRHAGRALSHADLMPGLPHLPVQTVRNLADILGRAGLLGMAYGNGTNLRRSRIRLYFLSPSLEAVFQKTAP